MNEPIHYLEHAADVISCAIRMIAQTRRFVLVTVIDIKGGSSRELGTLALIADDGQMYGYLSNGCIDRDIQIQGAKALSRKAPQVLKYGVGSPFMDLTLPCGGSLTLLLDPVPDHEQLRAAHQVLRGRYNAQLRFHPPGLDSISFSYSPPGLLVLAGRGSVFRAVAACGQAAGFDLYLLSPEEQDLQATAHFDRVKQEKLASPDAVQKIPLDNHSAFLTLFHDHSWEPHLLAEALKTPVRFIGALGSRRTHEDRRQTLMGMGVPERQVDRICGPIGLVSSLRQAPLIGVSAVAHVTEAFTRSIVAT